MSISSKLFLYLTALLLAISACNPKTKTALSASDDGKISFDLLQLNDVYEIFPLENGKVGGMARAATIRKSLKSQNSLCIMAGDFLNPSVIGNLTYENKKIRGRQMVEVMNTFIDLVTFGNHEFDLDKNELKDRMNESKFNWVSSNCWQNNGGTFFPFSKIDSLKTPQSIPNIYVWTVKDADGTAAKIGFFGVTLPSTKKDYVHYDDFFQAAKAAVERLKTIEKVDVIVGITHLNFADDQKLAALLPDVPLLIGGHDHNNMLLNVGNSKIAKADANAKTVYQHHFEFDKRSKKILLNSILIPITDKIPEDSATQKIVTKWEKITTEIFEKSNFQPKKIIAKLQNEINGSEAYNRFQQSELGGLITSAMCSAWADTVDCALLNSGSIRLDDILQTTVNQYDILRTLPFGGGIPLVKMKGKLLKSILDIGQKNIGSGGYLQRAKVSFDEKEKNWIVAKKVLENEKIYSVVLTDFLILGKEKGLDMITKDNADIISIEIINPKNKDDERTDIRKSLINHWKSRL